MEPATQLTVSVSLSIDQCKFDDIHSFKGHETLNQPYSFKIQFLNPELIEPKDVLGLSATLSFQALGETRCVEGIVYAFEIINLHSGSSCMMACEIRPRLSLMSLSGQPRVYLNQTAQEVIRTLFARHHIQEGLGSWRLGRRKLNPYPQWVQSQGETDFDFFERVLAREGINYLWDVDEPYRDRPAFIDKTYDLPRPIGLGRLYHREQGGLSKTEGGSIYQLAVEDQFRDYGFSYLDYEAQSQDALVEKNNPRAPRQVSVWGWGAQDPNQLRQAALMHREAQMMEEYVFQAKSQFPMPPAGNRVTIHDFPIGLSDASFILLSIEHQYEDEHYHNQIRFIYDDKEVRPIPKTKPAGQMVHTGKIESPNDLPYLDQNGGYRYHSHLHNSEEGQAASQVALRLTPYAGKSVDQAMGMHFPLKGNAEVLVMYFHSDFNQPVLQNSPANALNHAPLTSENSWCVLLKTAWNQYLEFSDRKQREEVTLANAQNRNRLSLKNYGKKQVFLGAEGGYMTLESVGLQQLKSSANIYSRIEKDWRIHSEGRGHVSARTLHYQASEQHYTAIGEMEINSERYLEVKAKTIDLHSEGDLKVNACGEWIQVDLPNGDLLLQAESLEISSDKLLSLRGGGAGIQLSPKGIALEALTLHFDSDQALVCHTGVNYSPAAGAALSQNTAQPEQTPSPVPVFENEVVKRIGAPVWDRGLYSYLDEA